MRRLLPLLPLAALAAVPAGLEALRPRFDPGREMAGDWADLPTGRTYYRWYGEEGRPVTVLVHGLTTASYVFGALAPRLAAQGRRVLVYDLYGRGLSDRPRGAQTAAFFLDQLDHLLEHLGIEHPVTLAGYSMGGSIATLAAAAWPEQVRRLVLLAPAGLVHLGTGFDETCRKTPLLGDWVAVVLGGLLLRRSLDEGRSEVPDIAQRQAEDSRTAGYMRSVLSSQRYLLSRRLGVEHLAIAATGTPVLAIWGRQDSVIPLEARDDLAALNPEALQVVIEAGHGLPHTHASLVAQEIDNLFPED